jgi:uncharacterized membrane protein YfcA
MSQRIAARAGASVSGRSASLNTYVVCPSMSPGLLRLALIGSLAGAFSGLFGVGGGTVIVPLLVLWFGFGEREATGTSLAAIVLIAGLAAGIHGVYGNVHVDKALIVAGPALAGVVAGTALQQRIPERAVSAGFALILTVSAAVLVF